MEPRTELETPTLQRSDAKLSNGGGRSFHRHTKPASSGSPATTKPLKLRLEEQAAQNEERLLTVLRRAGPAGLTPGEARQQAGMIHSTYANVARRLAESGAIVRDGQRRVQLHPADWAETWKSPPGARADLAELRRREAAEAAPAGSLLPAVASIMYLTLNGRRLDVPTALPTRCAHPPDELETFRLSLGGNLRPGAVAYCAHGCYRGGLVGMWAWHLRTGWRSFGTADSERSLMDRLGDWTRGRTPEEAESGRRALARRAARRARV